MKILYLSCHAILEYDEVKLLTELGHEVFSPGAYVEPMNPGDASLRPGIEGLEYNPEVVKMWQAHEHVYPERNGKEYLTKEIVDYFDIVMVMHMPDWIVKNWQAIQHKVVVWRTIGQSIDKQEAALAPYRSRINIVRYSPRESSIPNYIGENAIIRFYKDPDEFKDWNGDGEKIVTFAQSMKQRGSACNFDTFDKATTKLPRALFGPGNEGSCEGAHGKVSFNRLKEEMRNSRVYFAANTHPASYTLNFIEAWMTGIPVVAVGHKFGNSEYIPGHYLYEIHDLIDNGTTGFWSNSVDGLRQCCIDLLKDHDLARQIGAAGRAKAIELFGKETIKEQWRAFLSAL